MTATIDPKATLDEKVKLAFPERAFAGCLALTMSFVYPFYYISCNALDKLFRYSLPNYDTSFMPKELKRARGMVKELFKATYEGELEYSRFTNDY